MGETFKCMSVRQPYAWLIIIGEKKIENKSRAASYRGTVLIHSSSNKSDFLDFQKDHPDLKLHPSWLSFGTIIGAVNLADVVVMSPKFEKDPWANGPYCYLLENPIWFQQPIQCTGQVGLFNLPAQHFPRVQEELSKLSRKLSGIDDVLKILRPSEVDILWERMHDAIDGGLHFEARNILDSLAQKSPREAAVYRWRATVRASLVDLRGALNDYNQAIACNRSDLLSWLDKGTFLEEMGFLEKALECYEFVVSQDGKNAEAFLSRGNIKIKMKDYAGAMADLSRSIELDPQEPKRIAIRGFLNLMLERENQANQDFEKSKILVESQLLDEAESAT